LPPGRKEGSESSHHTLEKRSSLLPERKYPINVSTLGQKGEGGKGEIFHHLVHYDGEKGGAGQLFFLAETKRGKGGESPSSCPLSRGKTLTGGAGLSHTKEKGDRRVSCPSPRHL